ncbi:MAG TPA: haloacid dehalogenase type II [Methylovirgula sp.]
MKQGRKQSDVYVFDAYGTLFDVHSAVTRHRAAIGAEADRLSDLWRIKQLEYSWVRSLCDAYRDFAALTEDALDFAAARYGGLSSALRSDLLAAYRKLDAYPEVGSTLAALRDRGARLAILSNGTGGMLADAVAAAGLGSLFEAILSVDEAKIFKTAPQAYALVERHMNVSRGEVCFVSSNRWDIAGAMRYGFSAVWINRAQMPDEYPDLAPIAQLSSLEGLTSVPINPA